MSHTLNIDSALQKPNKTQDSTVKSVFKTIQSFISSPVNTINASAKDRERLIKINEAYRLLLKLYHQFKFNVYKVDKSLIFHLYIPSETHDKLKYDVCIEFMDVASMNDVLITKNIRVFCNAPSFMYYYAYVYNDRDLLIPFFRSKISKEALEKSPVIRNKLESLSYEKYLTIAIIYLKEKIIPSQIYTQMVVPVSKLKVKDLVKHANDIDEDYKRLNAAEAASKKVEKAEKRKIAAAAKKAKSLASKSRK